MPDDRPPEPPIDELIVRAIEADGVCTLRIDRPHGGNALTQAMRDRLADELLAASADLHVRAVLLTATGERHFCTGAALGGPRNPEPPRPAGAPDRAAGDAARMIRSGWQRLVSAVLDCEKPVVCALNGTAAGGGAQLALSCDLIVMSETAKIVEVFVRRGIMPDAGASWLLPRIVGLPRAKELLLLGDDVDAATALRMGLVNRVVAPTDLAPAALDLARRLAAGPTRALAATKALCNRSLESSRAQSFDDEALAQELVAATDDAREGMAAFAERRDPVFRGW